MNVIDADAHVEESPSMFESLDKEFYSLRPLPLGLSRDTVYGAMNACWLIDGEVYPKMSGNGAAPFSNPTLMESAKNKPVSIPAQELTDVKARLKDLDKLGIEEQVVYPTLFLRVATDNRKFEAALLRCYNDFISRACAKSEGRIHFAALVPTSDVAAAVEELRRARDLGAVATMLFGVNRDKTLDDRELYPLYEEAASLGLPVIIHLGYGCPAINKVFDFNNRFNSSVMPVLMGFRSLMSSEVLETFPKLRVGFLEAGAMWLPWMIQQLRRSGGLAKDPATYLREGRVYIACEGDEDLNLLADWVGEDCMVTASDYPHEDASKEENMVSSIMGREDVPMRVREKILSSNPARLYDLWEETQGERENPKPKDEVV